MSDLHVFCNGTDKVIATDIEDAWAAWCETTGESREAYSGETWAWEQMPDDASLPIMRDPESGDRTKDTLTCAEWVAKDGRGFLCSTEW